MNILGDIWLKGSIARAMLLSLLSISIIPIVIISITFINTSMDALTRQMEANLQILVEAKAEEINIRLDEILNITQIATEQASLTLEKDISSEEMFDFNKYYKPDSRNIVGLDVYYYEEGAQEIFGENLSNVYWDNTTPLNDEVIRQVIQTEDLDSIFASIKSVSPETQWIYVTVPDGMMRLYPWNSNDHYPDGWNPHEIIFYTVAEPGNNPSLEPQWTPPYVDFAGAGWMITLSIPILDEESNFLGVMSHDITISSLKDIALNINVLDGAGYGFLINDEGGIIAHPDFQNADATKGSQEDTNLLNVGSSELQALVRQMVDGETGSGYFHNEDNEENILVYAPVPAIGWSLGIIVPRTEVIAPAMAMRSRALIIMALFVVIAATLAVLLTRTFHKPLMKLLHGVHQVIEDRHQAEKLEVESFDEITKLASAFNEMSAKVWERQQNLKATVAELTIEIDIQRKKQQIDDIVETDYFKYLEVNAERLRDGI